MKKEEAQSEDNVLCRNMVILTLCAAVLGAVFYCWAEKKKKEGKRIAVYELTWPEEEDGRVVFHMWRYFIETETRLPRRIEKYCKDDPNGEYVLRETLIIDYPTDEQMRKAIEDMHR